METKEKPLTARLHMHLSQELHDKLDKRAKDEGLTISSMVRNWIINKLKESE